MKENLLAQWFCFVQRLLESPQRVTEGEREERIKRERGEPAAVTTE